MNCLAILNLQYGKLWKVPTKDEKMVNALCIVEQDFERSMVVLDHYSGV